MFVGYVQVFSDKAVKTLKCSAFVQYPAHVVLRNCSKELRQHLIDNGHSVEGSFSLKRE